MANFTISPNMLLPIPVVGIDPGPDYATNQDSCYQILDQHNHTPGSGVPIPPSGLIINSDLPFGGNNITLLRSIRFQLQGAPLSGSLDLSCLYSTDSAGDLWYNDGSGNQIQITKNGLINATSSGITSGTASASFVAGVLVVDAAANTPANIQGASILLGNNTAFTKFLTLSPPSAMGASYELVLPNVPPVLEVMTIDNAGNMGTNTFDQVGQAMTSVGANAIANTRTRQVGTSTGPVGAVANSPSTFAFSTTSTTWVTATSLSLTTSGRPVQLIIQSDGSGSTPNASNTQGNTTYLAIRVLNTTTNISLCQATTHGQSVAIYANDFFGISGVDFFVGGSPGTYTYDLQVEIGNFVGGTTAFFQNFALIAYEL